ncbi:histidine phosphatase family protein [Kitasatospora camelliae]|uniref:Histidine phosphatase family protein n=1 Tax=Kitasatospora camelliae TaxID=3156397 RepID=A0AAU8K4X2_9ACTN
MAGSTARVMLVSPAVGADLRAARFGGDAPPDAAGLRAATGAAAALPAADRHLAGPSARCTATAGALGLRARETGELADLDPGRWRGRRLEEVAAEDPAAVAQWLADPAAAPHGGESVLDLCARVAGWLDGEAVVGGRVLAVVEPAVVRAAVVRALGLPAAVFWRLDVAPLTVTELTGRAGRWNLRCGRPLPVES